MGIIENFERLKREVGGNVEIVVAVKGRSVSQIKEAYRAGARVFGENRVQDAEDRFDFYGMLGITLHMIGHLQKNKVKRAVRVFDCIQSVDSIELAKKIDEEAGKIGKKILVMLQVNISRDVNKFGFDPNDIIDAVKEVEKLSNVILIGLMTITSRENKREDFRAMREIYDSAPISHKFYLSMGMSDSYKIAIEEGANMIRIGRAIFE